MAAKVKLPRTRRSYYRKYQNIAAVSKNAVGVELTYRNSSSSKLVFGKNNGTCTEKNGFARQISRNYENDGCQNCDGGGGVGSLEELGHEICANSRASKSEDNLLLKNDGLNRVVNSEIHCSKLDTGSDSPLAQSLASHRRLLEDSEDEKKNCVSRQSSHGDGDHIAEDVVDHMPADLKFTWLDVLVYFISIGSYIADVGSDLWVSYLYFTEKRWWWFGLTLGFIIVPSLITTTFSLTWYIQDHKYHKKTNAPGGVGACRWVSRLIFHILQLGPVLRYFDTLVYGWKTRNLDPHKDGIQRKHWYELMLYEDTDSALLRLIECFMEAAPQLTLQLYIMCEYGPTGETTILVIGQGIACVTSLASLAFALTSYHRALRFSLEDKANLGYMGMFMQFLWRFFTIGARVLAMALFATKFTYWVFVLAGCHWGIMLVWVLTQRTNFCYTKWQEFLFNVVAAAIYIFCYLNLVEGHTRLRYLCYYCLVYGQNLLMILGWWTYANTITVWYRHPSIAMVCGGFFVGVIFQVVYYLRFHPNNYPPFSQTKKIKVCLTWQEMRNKPQNTRRLYLSHQAHSENIDIGNGDSEVVEVMIGQKPVKVNKDCAHGEFV